MLLEYVIGTCSLLFEVVIIVIGLYQRIVIGHTEKEEPIVVEEFSYRVLEILLIGDVWHVLCEDFVWYELPWKTTPVIYENNREDTKLKGITIIPIVTRKRWFRRNKTEYLLGQSSKELHVVVISK